MSDVLIIGGGINGIATFRDLALQGVDVALVEVGQDRRQAGHRVTPRTRRCPAS